jgi:hypothetical protein
MLSGFQAEWLENKRYVPMEVKYIKKLDNV